MCLSEVLLLVTSIKKELCVLLTLSDEADDDDDNDMDMCVYVCMCIHI